jgi:integrase
MPRKVDDKDLRDRTSRSKLKVAHKPYFRLIEPGLHIGYRKLASGPGTWIVRRYTGEGRYVVENLRTQDGRLVIADDYSDADGGLVLDFGQAQRRVLETRIPVAGAGPFTVNNALDDYLRYLEGEGRATHSLRDTRTRAAKLIRPKLGAVKVAELESEQLRKWRDDVARTAGRRRTFDPRARMASTNRVWTILRAALNHAFENRKDITSDAAWRKVKPFKGVDAARPGYLSVTEARRLINACEPDFQPLVQAALQTGARYSELARLTVRDFNADGGTVHIAKSKSGKQRDIVLTDEGRTFFAELIAGRAGNEPMFRRQWGFGQQTQPMQKAVAFAKIEPPISFHGLRHTWASLAVMNGTPLMVVARNLGHADTRMVEKHYGHLAPSYVTEAIRKGAPKFGFKPNDRVVSLK